MTFSTGSPSRRTQSKKVESKKLIFDFVRKPDLGFSRKKPFSTGKSDCVINGLTAAVFTGNGTYSVRASPLPGVLGLTGTGHWVIGQLRAICPLLFSLGGFCTQYVRFDQQQV